MQHGQHDPGSEADGTVLGLLEDDHMRAVVTSTGDEVVVTLEGRIDESGAPVVDELLDAVGRWPGRAERRRPELAEGRAVDEEPDVVTGATLLLDTRRVELDPASRRMLADHRERWRRDHGPAESLSAAAGPGTVEPTHQGSKR